MASLLTGQEPIGEQDFNFRTTLFTSLPILSFHFIMPYYDIIPAPLSHHSIPALHYSSLSFLPNTPLISAILHYINKEVWVLLQWYIAPPQWFSILSQCSSPINDAPTVSPQYSTLPSSVQLQCLPRPSECFKDPLPHHGGLFSHCNPSPLLRHTCFLSHQHILFPQHSAALYHHNAYHPITKTSVFPIQ